MKTQFKWLTILILLVTAVTLTAFNQNDKNKNNKQEQKQDKGQGQDKGNKGNGNKGRGNNNQKNKGNQNDNRGNGNSQINRDKVEARGNSGNNGKDNNSANKDNKGLDKDDDVRMNRGNNSNSNIYIWDRETFRDREKIRSNEKVTICHKFGNSNEPAVTIRISANAQKAHIAHGDVVGECPQQENNRFSDIFIDRRNDYYTTLYETQEQVSYSRSILNYALERLAASRLQLSDMQRKNLAQEEIERKQAAVYELEENVTLLEALLGVASNLIVNKLQD